MRHVFDVAIIGGGINGCGCAADAALRGLSVVLFEQDDIASKTSSSSTKLIHGGLRYLEQKKFRLVKKALEERQTLLNCAPHLVYPQAFVLPHLQNMRPTWLLRLGLFLYDHLSKKNQLPKCQSLKRTRKDSYFKPLIDSIIQGFLFYDAGTDDARLTITNALQAKLHGASIRPYSKVTDIQVHNKIWQLTIVPEQGPSYVVHAKSLINAAGPWVEDIAKLTEISANHHITMVKGSHILVPELYPGKQAYFLQHHDTRVIFVIPYHGFSMIGTTDILYTDSLSNPLKISMEEIDYLLDLVNTYFKSHLHYNDLIDSWSGIRPLLSSAGKDPKSLSRDYCYEFNEAPAPIVTIFGGKITTYRQLAEESVNCLSRFFPDIRQCQTKSCILPGGSLASMSFDAYRDYANHKYHWLDKKILNRYLHSYGTNTELFLASCTTIESMGKQYGSSLYQIELDYLISHEWARHADDILERRTKLGLTMDSAAQNELKQYLTTLNAHPLQSELLCH